MISAQLESTITGQGEAWSDPSWPLTRDQCTVHRNEAWPGFAEGPDLRVMSEYSLSVSSPLPLPIRILIKGPSTVNWISWMGGPRSDLAYPRVIEDELLMQGRPAEIRNTAILGEPMGEWFGAWEEDILQFTPDVLVLSAAHYECVHLFLPHWFERHANLYATRGSKWRAMYRKRVLRPIWTVLVILQGKLDAALPTRIRRGRMRRAVGDLRAYITHAQQVGSPLVLVMELLRPAARQSGWFPGMTGRVEFTNALMKQVVDGFDLPNVRWFATSEISEKFHGDDLQAATPDGFHLTPQLHRAVGAELARDIMEWGDTQPHLRGTSASGL